MKQTMLLKLVPTPEQVAALLDTLHAVNAACNYAGEIAFTTKTSNKFELQKLVYGPLRVQYGLPAQLAIRAISKTVEAYKRDKRIQPTFTPEGAIAYDPRVMAFKSLTTVSLLTLQGRILVPFRVGAYQAARMEAIQGQADLIYRTGQWYLAATLDVPTPPAEPADGGTLGVDLGIVNLAADSDGETFSGVAIEQTRQRMGALRAALQTRGTKSAKRHLKRLSGREARFRRDTNHCISKHIVAKAKHSHKRIALEDLRHVRSRTERTVRKSQRQRHSSWAFFQLRAFIAYKAAVAGVPLDLVDPRDTSRTCSRCGHCEDANRKTQAAFVCQNPVCGFAVPADWNAAVNISRAAPSDSLSSRSVDRLDNQAVA
jgi:IS605 OrfB family transposase